MLAILHILGWVFFFASAVLLTVVVLLQEPKGGGLAEAFGGMGAETFGVKSGGINRFTFTLAAIFCGSAILISSTWWTA
jgi:protein translocase SecG subunit